MKRNNKDAAKNKSSVKSENNTSEQKNASQKPRKTMKQRKKEKIRKIILSIVAGILLVAITVTLILVGINEGWGRENNIFKKNSYSTWGWLSSWSRNRVVATLGDHTLTNGQLQILYTMHVMDYLSAYSSNISYSGIDLTKPLSKQNYDSTGLTWEKHFIQEALLTWVEYCAINTAADKAGFELPQEFTDHLTTLEETMKKSASDNGFGSIDDMLKAQLGENVRYGDYYNYLAMYYKNELYINDLMDDMEVTYAQIDEYFEKNEDALKQSGITKKSGDFIDVRHILIMPEGGTTDAEGKVTYTEAEWAACRAKAQAVYDEWKNGEMTEDSFSKLANEKSQDKNGKVTNGGLYENVYNGQMTTEFNDWCFADMRNPGDHGLIKTEFGYHVMYFVETEQIWMRYCRQGIKSDRVADLIDEYVEKVSWEINFGNIVLDDIEFS